MEFKITKHITIEAEYYETRYLWGHKAWIFLDGEEVGYAKATYYNRTWESYEFQSVCQSVVEKARKLTKQQKAYCQNWLEKYEEPNRFAPVAMVAMLGELMTDNQKDANDWKARMIKAGLPDGAIQMPDDWDTLNEETKQARLDGVIKILGAK